MESAKVVAPPNIPSVTSSSKSGSASSTTMPWVEKHRPRELKDIVGNEDTIEMLQHFALKGNMPNVLLCGTPGKKIA